MIRTLAFLLTLLIAGPAAAQAAHSLELLRGDSNEGINPRYLLQDPNGRSVTSEDFRGRYQLIAFGYTYCPDICPTTLVEMAEILKQLGATAKHLQAIFISVDPERDTGKVHMGKVPPYSVVVSGSLPGKPLPDGTPGPSLYCAVIVKTVDAQTRSKTGINELLRD